ncbi:unnamed protein product [Coregonus sp. 'balchen']|nr:unnamed protein product [Coregonus sp. 'balchen']
MAAISKYLTAKNCSIAGATIVALYLLKRKRHAAKINGVKRSSELHLSKDEAKKERTVVDKVFFARILKIVKIMVPGVFCKESGYCLLIAAMLISLVNNFLKLGLNELKLCCRVRLTKHLYDEYLQGYTYYKIGNLDNRIGNPDQLLTQDPLLDIGLYIFKLTSAIGPQGPACMIGYLVFSGLILTRLRRPIGKMTVMEQRYEGEYRFVNSRLITNRWIICTISFSSAFQLVSWTASLQNIATVVGYLVVSRPFLNRTHPRHLHSTHAELLEDYYQSGRMLLSMSQALGRIVLAGREMSRLSGFTARITEIIKVLKELNSGKYERTMVSQQGGRDGELQDRITLVPGSGEIIHKDKIIKFEHTPLATPNGDILIKDLSFEVTSGTNVLVCGPNGCGKSSLFRVLGELWPLFGGRLTKPERGKLFYVPQRPYMTLGSLRDQVIYPDTVEDQRRKGTFDKVLKEYLDNVQLGHILEREGSWDTVQDWMDVLSGGEKQRMAMARLFYHKPQFAILDECTSAVSVDVEDFIYSHCRTVGITLFTVSHRKSLWKHHEYYLHMDGRGNYEFKAITQETVEFGS